MNNEWRHGAKHRPRLPGNDKSTFPIPNLPRLSAAQWGYRYRFIALRSEFRGTTLCRHKAGTALYRVPRFPTVPYRRTRKTAEKLEAGPRIELGYEDVQSSA
jgi:hypothetical protein